MGIAPLLSWRRASARRLGKAAWVPLTLSVLATALIYVLGHRKIGALIGYWVSIFVALTTLMEFWNGAQARRRARGESLFTALNQMIVRNRRRYGGYIIHLSVVLMAIGITGSHFYQQETQGTISQGETLTLGGFTMVYDGLREWQQNPELYSSEATVSVFRNKEQVATLHPRRDYYPYSGQSITIPSVRSTIGEDFYVILVGWESVEQSQATFKVYLNPLINWLWAGAFLLIFGTLVAAWPDKRTRPAVSTAYRPGTLVTDQSAAS
jgi:cytochrome c-type biogenesis protein CcmF